MPNGRYRSLFVLALWLSACGTRPSSSETGTEGDASTNPDVISDGGAVADTSSDVSAPDSGGNDVVEVEPVQITLTCDFEREDTLDFETGQVTSVATNETRDADLRCFLGRFVGLTTSDRLCAVASPVAALASIELLDDCQSADSPAWQTNLLCGVNINGPFEPACVGTGLIVRDPQTGILYRVFIVEDFIGDERGNGIVLQYERLSP